MKGEPANSAADQLAIAIDSNPGGGGTIKVTWESTEYSVDFNVQK